MKTLLTIVLICTALALPGLAAPAPEPAVTAVEDFNLESFKQKVVVLDFWASWCKPCQKSLPWLAGLQEKYGEQGLQVVAVNLDQDLEDAAEMIAALPAAMILVHDPEGILAQKYQLEGMPSAFVFGRDGQLAATHVGFLDKDAKAKEIELKQLIEEGTDSAGH